MKVRCIKLVDGFGQPVSRSSWVSVGHVYHVLEVLASPERTRIRIVGDSKTPALYHLEMFELVSGVIPAVWTVSSLRVGHFCICPKSWSADGFWEAYFDGNPEAGDAFQEGLNAIVNSDP